VPPVPPAQRRAYLPGAALAAVALGTVLAAGVTGCDGPGSAAGGNSGATGSAGESMSAQPGKYQTLPEACGLVSRKTLQSLLPGAAEDDQVYDGTAAVTFDTDRRVGCHWKVGNGNGTRELTLDFQRVVSYDPSVSDDDEAQRRYQAAAAEAHVPGILPPVTPPVQDGSASASTSSLSTALTSAVSSALSSASAFSSGSDSSSGSASGSPTSSGSASSSSPSTASASGSPSSDPSSTPDTGGSAGPSATATPVLTAPRRLGGIGDEAYLDDRLTTTGGLHREVTVVFLASNVIATIGYEEWPADHKSVPSSEQMQADAQDLAKNLTGHLGG
jgi:hypothetical protein